MGTSVQVTPLCGVYNEHPLSYLVSVDGFNFLIDCGWNDLFDPSLLQPLSKVSSTIDAVLLSHPDTLHLGALPYAMKHLGLSAPVYATEPVHRLGLLTMYDHYMSRKQVSEFDLFTLDDIDTAFQNVTRLTYSQNYHISGKGEGIVIAPYVAGHLLGGAVWKITKDGEDVIYAVDFNHRKERHLNGTVLESFVRPAVLITDAYNALNNQPSRRQRDQEFLDAIVKALRADGNILLPVDTAGRVLELLLLLEQYWAQHHLTYPIFFLTNVSTSTIDYVKSFLEWMSDSIAKSFEHTRDNAFLLKHVRLLISKHDLEKIPDGPKPTVRCSGAVINAGGGGQNLFAKRTKSTGPLFNIHQSLRGKLQSLNPNGLDVRKYRCRWQVDWTQTVAGANSSSQNLSFQFAHWASWCWMTSGENGTFRYPARLSPDGPDRMLKYLVISTGTLAFGYRGARLFGNGIAGRWSGGALDDGAGIFIPSSTKLLLMRITLKFPEHVSQTSRLRWICHGYGTGAGTFARHQLGGWRRLGGPGVKATCSLFQSLFSSYWAWTGSWVAGLAVQLLKFLPAALTVLVHGSAEATEHLKEHCAKNVCPHVYAPQIGETIDVTSDLCAYKVQLSEKLMSNVLFKKLGDYEVAWVDAEVGKTDGVLSLLPLSTPAPPHRSVLVGDLKLADFKQFLASKGVQVEFAAGALRCGEYVTLRKVGDSSQKGASTGTQQRRQVDKGQFRDKKRSQKFFLGSIIHGFSQAPKQAKRILFQLLVVLFIALRTSHFTKSLPLKLDSSDHVSTMGA
ncbi:hypothetical protein H6P81_017119 [Aristolochia fimbriata]|uniref:Cleavage and polyadenylation specificity factor subunit 2 n=1 Tax=Aristolochia fimbriata TaxID=158543 RepID=A0AAV7DZ93_ARIFI|nr:hypothetical protein H6P81_017119 [Aristolochia fimbriata]